MASTRLSETMGTPTLRTKFTYSVWVKRSALGSFQTIASMWNDGNNHVVLRFTNTNALSFYDYSSSSISGELVTNAVYRDTNSWYHIVAQFDSTQATAGDRMKLYVNGERITSFTGTEAYPSQNFTPTANTSGSTSYVGGRGDGSYYDGLISQVIFVDGTAYDASTFGSTDSTSGEWKPNANPTVSYGNNGFKLTFEDTSNLGDDTSGNTNDFTMSGTGTSTLDCPSNAFATWNDLKKLTITLSNGNTTTLGNGDNGVWSTIGNNSGKWYWETQQNANSTMMGIINEDVTQTTGRSDQAGVYGLQSGNGSYAYYRNNGSSGQSSGFPEITNSNVLCHALDLDNGKYFLGIDGVFKNLSGTTSNVGTGADPTFSGLDTTKFWFPFTESRGTGVGCDANFGNGYFGTTAVTSAGTGASTPGIFEYNVPNGYQPLTTKGLNT